MSAGSPQDWFHRLATDYVAAQAVFHLNQAGVFARLEAGPATAGVLSRRLHLRPVILAGLLDYLVGVEELLRRRPDGRYALSRFGRAVLARYGGAKRGRFNLFDVRVGAYGPVWSSLGEMLAGRARYGKEVRRDGRFSAAALPLVARGLLPALRREAAALPASGLVELGVGSGLLERLAQSPRWKAALGVDRDPAALLQAAPRRGVRADVFDLPAWAGKVARPSSTVFFSIHFHEFLAAGRPKLVGLLRSMRRAFPGSFLILLEEPRQPLSARARLGRTRWLYGQSNVLIHDLVGKGRILSSRDWARLIAAAGCRLRSARPTGYLDYAALVIEL